MSSLDVASWIAGSASRLIGVRVGNIYASGPDVIVFKFKGMSEELVVEPGRRIHLTRRRMRFGKLGITAQILRKHLRGRVIGEVRQYGFERIVELVFKPDGVRLVVELLPRGVAALLDPEGRIIYATRYAEYRDRAVRRGEPYTPPPLRALDPRSIDAGTLAERLVGAPDVVRGLIRNAGWPPELAEETLRRAGVNKALAPSSLRVEDAEKIVAEARRIVEECLEKPEPTIVYRNSEPLLVAPFKPSYIEEPVRYESFATLDEALDHYFSLISSSKGVDEEESRLMKALEDARRSAEEYARRAVELRRLAEKASQNILVLEEKLECARRVRKEEGWGRVASECGVSKVEPSKGLVHVELDGDEVILDIRLSAGKNVLELYRRAGELEAKAKRAEKTLSSVEDRLEELRRKRRLRELRDKIRARPKEWYEKYHWMISSEGFLVIGGRNIDQNESIVRRYLEPHDIFMHADIHGAPVVIIKTGGKTPGEATFREAAVIAAAYSKAWREGLAYVDVYWAWGSQVSKTPPPGEYLPKGSFMVYGKRSYLRGIRVYLALGVEEHEGYPRITVGSEKPVAARTLVYAILVPGSLKPLDATSRIQREFARIDKANTMIYEAMDPGEIAERIPGPSRIISVRRGEIEKKLGGD